MSFGSVCWVVILPSRGDQKQLSLQRSCIFLEGGQPKVDGKGYLGGGFKYVLSSPLFGEDSHFD